MTSVILLVCEVSIALISSCIPSIFNLAKHTVAEGFSRLSSKPRSSRKPGSGVHLHMVDVGRSIQEGRKGGFQQLEGGHKDSKASNGSLFGSAD